MRLLQVLTNLISNALKFTEKGNVVVEITKSEDVEKNRQLFSFSVADTGVGIPEAMLNSVFEKFKQVDDSIQRKYGGTGLGLAISQEIASLLGGKITIESKEGNGSKFTLILPENIQVIENPEDSKGYKINQNERPDILNDNEMISLLTPDEIDDDRNNIGANDETILLVEDDVIFAKLFKAYIGRSSYKLVVAVSGDSGIEYARKYKPKFIFLDIQLPIISGWQVLEELKKDQATQNIPVCVLSSLVQHHEAFLNGAAAFLRKPVSRDGVREKIAAMSKILDTPKKNCLIIGENINITVVSKALNSPNINWFDANTTEESLRILSTQDIYLMVIDFSTIKRFSRHKQNEEFVNYIQSIPVVLYNSLMGSKIETKDLLPQNDVIIHQVNSIGGLRNKTNMLLHDSQLFEVKYSEELSKIPKKTAVIIDNDVRTIYSLTQFLEEHSFNVISVVNNEDYNEIIQKQSLPPVLFVDTEMKHSRSVESIKKIDENIPVIFLSKGSLLEKIIDNDDYGEYVDIISKPIDFNRLKIVLNTIFCEYTEKQTLDNI